MVTRVSHWANVLCLVILLMSGLQIFNAHPALYWGEDSDFERPVLAIYNTFTGEGRPLGVTRVFGRTFDTTGVLGRSQFQGRPAQRAFPSWLTIPSAQDLATGRVWHFFFAWLFVINGLIYVGSSIYSRRFTRERLHAYHLRQTLAYLFVILIVAPLAVLSGLTMSPAVTAAAPWLLDVFGGRQSARTIHFILTGVLVVFVLVHVVMVLVSGFIKNMRAMITGWYAVAGERARHEDA